MLRELGNKKFIELKSQIGNFLNDVLHLVLTHEGRCIAYPAYPVGVPLILFPFTVLVNEYWTFKNTGDAGLSETLKILYPPDS